VPAKRQPAGCGGVMSILKSAATVGGNTFLSRILGLVRDILIAGALGAGPIADAFWAAFRFPNLFRRFFAEGAFNAAFVPLFAKTLEGEGKAEAKRFAEEVLAIMLMALLTVCTLAMIFMPALTAVFAPGFLSDPQRLDLTVLFSRIAFPYLLFMSLTALFAGMLNSLGRFAAGGFAPVLLNISLICAVVFVAPHTQTPGHALVWGVAVAGVLQLSLLIWGAARQGLVLGLRLPKMTPRVKRMLVLGVPGVIAGGITQVNVLVGTMIASFQDGAIAILAYADRIYQLPLALIGVAMGIVLLPEIARRVRAADESGAAISMNRAIELSMLFTLPATAALMVIPLPIIAVLFQESSSALLGASKFGDAEAALTALALAAFAAGLPGFVLQKVLQPGYFAREDTKTPMYFALANTLTNVILSLILFPLIGLVGIALATSVAGTLNAVLLGAGLYRRGHFVMEGRLAQRLIRIALATAIMAGGLYAATIPLAPWLGGTGLEKLGALMILVLGGMAVYGAAALGLGAARLSELRSALRPTNRPRPEEMPG